MKRNLILTAAAVLLSAGTIRAEENKLSFDELAKQAFLTSPEVAKIDATLSQRLADAFSARVRANPVLSSAVDLPRSNKNDEATGVALNISQTIRPSDFGIRSRLAGVIEESGGIEKQLALNQYIQNLGVLYARAWQNQEVSVLLRGASKRASQFLSKVSEGAERGIFSQGDVELFRAEQKSFEADSIAAQGELSLTSSELTRLTGVNIRGMSLLKQNDALPYTKAQIELLVRDSQLPLQKRVGLLKSLAHKQLEIARLDSFPAISPAIGYSKHDDSVEQITVGLSIPLPLFNRNQDERIRAAGVLAAAEQEQRYATSEAVVQEVLQIYEAFENVKQQVSLYESGVIPAKARAVDAYYRQFDAGIGTAFQLWQAFRELNSSQQRTIELRTSLSSVRAQLNALTGKQF